jgi:hypothetical protein
MQRHSGNGMAMFRLAGHRLGMNAGYVMRQQCIAAINSKVLRLNAAAVSHISNGHIVNLASNDARRFDDAMPFW